MGTCGVEKDSSKTKKKKENQIPDNSKDRDNKLKAPKPKNNYNIKFINNESGQENELTVEGEFTLNRLLTKFKLRYNADFTITFDNNESINSEQINEKLDIIFSKIFDEAIPEIINMKYSYTGLDIPENSIQAYIENNKIIGNAILDNLDSFGIITYDNENKSLKPYYYLRSEYPELIYFNLFTAYCNARNCLYFSGGEKEQTYEPEENSLPYAQFNCINLTELNNDKLVINQLENLHVPRTWHSMIFVPNKYIFIVGGSNTKSVELYDIDEKKLTEDSELKEIRCESTLCLVNDMYLYAFCGFKLHMDYYNTIERCNLFKKKREWEFVKPIEKSSIKFQPSFFAISYFKNNDLLLIGGNDSDENERFDYIYKVGKEENENDQIEDYKFKTQEKISIFKDKLFIPMKDNKTVNIPLIIGGEIKVIIFDTQNEEVVSHEYTQ